MKKPIFKTEAKRRYYLHKKVKQFYTVHSRKRQVDITPPLKSEVREYIKELAERFGYNIQTVIT